MGRPGRRVRTHSAAFRSVHRWCGPGRGWRNAWQGLSAVNNCQAEGFPNWYVGSRCLERGPPFHSPPPKAPAPKRGKGIGVPLGLQTQLVGPGRRPHTGLAAGVGGQRCLPSSHRWVWLRCGASHPLVGRRGAPGRVQPADCGFTDEGRRGSGASLMSLPIVGRWLAACLARSCGHRHVR